MMVVPSGMQDIWKRSVTSFPHICFVAFVLAFFAPLMFPGTAEAQVRKPFSGRNFTLNGNLTLFYDRFWSSQSDAVDRFAYSLNMNFHGFVIDPRLIQIELNGVLTQDFQKERTSTIDGFGAKIRFLTERPRKGVLRFFPQPVELRYAYYSYEEGDSQDYGISMAYRLAAPRASNGSQSNTRNSGNSNNGKKKSSWITLPNLYLDFNRYEYTTQANKNVHDRLDLRAEAFSEHADYSAEYLYYKNTFNGEMNAKTHYLELQANYHQYWKETSTRLDSANILYFEKTLDTKTVSFIDRTSWVKNFGLDLRDSLAINGGGRYRDNESTKEYALDLNATYGKFFSERLITTTTAGADYFKNDDDTKVGELAQFNMQYRLSNMFTFTGQASAGNREDGTFYGFNVGLLSRKMISINPAYEYRHDDFGSEKTTANTVYLNLSAPLLRKMSFFSQNYYRIIDTTDNAAFSKEKRLSLQANIFWTVSRYTVSVGASHTQISLSGGDASDILTGTVHGGDAKFTLTSVNANVSTYLSRRITLNVYAYYQKEKDRGSLKSIAPVLTWQWRRVSLTARYILNMRGNSQNDHRLFLRLTRQFDSILRPFW